MGEPTKFDVKQVRSLMKTHNMEVITITPGAEDLSHSDKGIRESSIVHVKDRMRFARDVGATFILTGAGKGHRTNLLQPHKVEWDCALESIEALATFGREIGVTVGIEAVNRYSGCLINTAETALKFMEQIGSENIKIVLDIFHMNIEETDPLGALRRVQGQLIHFHIGNNNRRGVGKGRMDYIPYIRTLKETGYDGTIGMEIMAPGPDPQVPIKNEHSEGILENDLQESLKLLRLYEEIV